MSDKYLSHTKMRGRRERGTVQRAHRIRDDGVTNFVRTYNRKKKKKKLK